MHIPYKQDNKTSITVILCIGFPVTGKIVIASANLRYLPEAQLLLLNFNQQNGFIHVRVVSCPVATAFSFQAAVMGNCWLCLQLELILNMSFRGSFQDHVLVHTSLSTVTTRAKTSMLSTFVPCCPNLLPILKPKPCNPVPGTELM